MKLSVMVFLILYSRVAFADIPKMMEQRFLNQNIPVQEVLFQNQHLYVVDFRSQCCDLGAQVFTKTGDLYCGFIGIAGAWTDGCKGFDEQAQHIKTYAKAESKHASKKNKQNKTDINK